MNSPYFKLKGCRPFRFSPISDQAHFMANTIFGQELDKRLRGVAKFKELPVQCHEPVCAYFKEQGAGDVPNGLEDIAKELRDYRPQQYPPCVYFLILENRVMYVGRGSQLDKKIRQHMQEGKVFDRVLYLPTAKESLESEKRRFVQKLRPVFNARDDGR